jgi:hypothetical protein
MRAMVSMKEKEHAAIRETRSVRKSSFPTQCSTGISGEHEVRLLQRVKDGEFTLRRLVREWPSAG